MFEVDHLTLILNVSLVTSEWTKIDVPGSKPRGRNGHTVNMVGSRFYIFGGQDGPEFFNDLWYFDLNSCKFLSFLCGLASPYLIVRSNDPHWVPVISKTSSEQVCPAPRTEHVCVENEDNLYMFGGTDGQYHYTDLWCFDTRTELWTEVQTIGFIPAPREGHAAAMVDDVMYIYGGRGVDGKDLTGLGGYKIPGKIMNFEICYFVLK